ncbi:DNA gyrase subunit A [Candidatus Woesearchaeota archaeon]|nr:DNA gyrase subunit A [Candidatus Woesearchaeota archaeon]
MDESTTNEPEPREQNGLSPGVFLRDIKEEMKQSYLDYAMSVIIGRALPDARDGLKPVHRRILFAMHELGIMHSKPFKKCARIVGEVLGKFHPHGDTAVYDALVRMAQDFSLRYPLIDGQGNFGSIDGDSAAAMRYTEARLAKIAEEMLQDIDKNTVDFAANFDATMEEPMVLPSKLPNLLINGSAGIAVGMATNIPPHNVTEVCNALLVLLENPDATFEQIMECIKGPDFPTGAQICGRNNLMQAYAHGLGKIRVKAKTSVEETKKGHAIIIEEVPFQVNKATMIEEIAELVKNKIIPGISDIRDESDKDIRVVIDLKKDAAPEIVLNQLYAHSRMQVTFRINLLALVDNQPRVLSIKELLEYFIVHRKQVVVRKTQFELDKAEKKAHVLEGLQKALEHLDAVIALIRKAAAVEDALTGLINSFSLSEIQAKAILDMRLQRLTGMEREKIISELEETRKEIMDLKDILASPQRVISIIKEETEQLKLSYGDERRTEILAVEDEDLDIEDLIEPEEMVVTVTRTGYVKRLGVDTYKQQKRGGKGITGTSTDDEDVVESLFTANTHDVMLFFTSHGQVHWLKVYKIPEASRIAKGKAIVNLLELGDGEKVTAMVPIKEFDEKHFLVMCTQKGVVKKTNLMAFSNQRAGGIRAIILDEHDTLIMVKKTDGHRQLMLATKKGMAVKFHEKDVRASGRNARGVKGITLDQDDDVIGMVIGIDNKTLLTITEHGYGKRTTISEYRLIRRGGSGVKNIICSERNGNVVSIKSATDKDELVVISEQGTVIRVPVKGIPVIGRNTQGVRIMKLDEKDTVVDAAKIVSEEDANKEQSGDFKGEPGSLQDLNVKVVGEDEADEGDESIIEGEPEEEEDVPFENDDEYV